MKIDEMCLPCLVGQMIKVAKLSGAEDRDSLYRRFFDYMSGLDLSLSSPRVVGDAFRMLKEHTGNPDPYRELRRHYNSLFLSKEEEYAARIPDIETAIHYAILGNIVDFGPAHENVERDVEELFAKADSLRLSIDHRDMLIDELSRAKTLLYMGDNCGEICFDKLLIRRIKERFPQLDIWFAVRGEPIINDSIEEDAYLVGMDSFARIISNGSHYPGTELEAATEEFRAVYSNADVLISKGQGNFESLSERVENIYFLFMTKCPIIARKAGTPEKALICRKNPLFIK